MDMNLDPELQVIADAATNLPHAADVPLEALRAGFVLTSQMNSLTDVPCDRVEDLVIPGPAGDIPSRSYVPKGAVGTALPGLVFFHGGGFMIGNLESHDSFCRQLANLARVKVIALDYRLAPEHKFPAAVDDCIVATEWVCAHADQLGLDVERIAVGGDSAGGNLAAVVCNHFTENQGPALAFQLLIYPGIDNSAETESRRALRDAVILDARVIEYFGEAYLGGVDVARTDPRVSPIFASSHAAVPPAHIVTAEYDPLRDEGKAYADTLEAAGVSVTYRCYGGLMHNFIQQTAAVSRARVAVEEMAAVLKEALSE